MVTTYEFLFGTSSNRDTLSIDATSDLHQAAGGTFVRCSRGYDRAMLGAQPRAGDMSGEIRNVGLPYSLYSPRPGLGVGLIKDIDATDHALWQGTLDIPEHSIHDGTLHPYIDVTALGPFSRLAGKTISTPLYENITTGTAMGHVLDAAGFPAGLRDIDVGEVTLFQWWADDADAFEMLKKLRQTEGITADLYENESGQITFRDRSARFDETRSNTIQSTFTSEGAEPRLTGFRWIPEFREIVNYAEQERLVLAAATSASVVWTDPEGLYLIAPDETLVLDVTAASGLPFKDAITPVEGTDFAVGFGSITGVTLDRDSGVTTRINYTAGSLGAVIGTGGAVTDMQLRATAFTSPGTYLEKSSIDATDSIAEFDLKPWQGEMWPVMPWDDMRDNLNAIVRWLKDPHGRVTFGVLANRGTAADTATATREIGDRVRIVESDLNVDVEAWIERIEHEVSAPARHFTTYECSVIDAEAALEEPGTPPTSDHGQVTGLQPEDSGVEESASTSRHIVTIDDQVSYVFYDDENTGFFSWSKTTDAGETWASPTSIDETYPAGGTVSYDVFYEKWASTSLANRVHLVRHQDASNRGIFYSRFDIDTETVDIAEKEVISTSAGPQNKALSIGVSVSGKILISHFVTLSGAIATRSTDGGANFASCTSLSEHQADRLILMPDVQSSDADDLMGLYWDDTASEISIKRYDWSGDTVASETSVATSMDSPPDSSASRQFAATMNLSTGHITLIACEQYDGTAGDLKAWDIYGTTVTALTDVLSSTAWLANVGIATDDVSIWAFYHRGATAFSDGQEYYKVSADGGTTWGVETQFATSSGNIRAVILDPHPQGSLLAGYRIGNLYYFDDTLATAASSTGSHEDNPFDSENASDSLGSGVDVNDQGTMMRGAVAAAHFGVFEL